MPTRRARAEGEQPPEARRSVGGGSGILEGAEQSAALAKGLRSRSRHLAMLTLYCREAQRFSDDEFPVETLRWLCSDPPRRARSRAIAEAALVERPFLDNLLGRALTGWSLERIGAVERAILRAAAAETLVLRDAPAGAVINDCVDLARRYGDEPAPGFVNAVLTQLTELPEAAAALALPASDTRGVDLHTHTDRSDGDYPPAELVRRAQEAGLVAVAVADHDDISGLDEAAAAGAELGVEVVPGVELTCYVGKSELHVLGLFIDHRDPGLIAGLEHFRGGRRGRAGEICRRLAKMGAPVDPARVLEIAGDGSVGRPHLAKALVEAGHCSSVAEAFQRYIGDRSPAYVPKVLLSPAEGIGLIHGAGGLALLAHPAVGGHEEMLPELVEAGLDGIEVRHSLHAEKSAEHYQRWAQRRDLCVSGGSDFHGPSLEGRPLGGPFVPETWLIELRCHWKLKRGPQASESGPPEPSAAPAAPADQPATDSGNPEPGTRNPEP